MSTESNQRLAETIEEIVHDNPDLQMQAPPAREHTLLEIWLNVLNNADEAILQKPTMPMAAATVRRWPFLSIQDIRAFSWAYHSNLQMMRDILQEEIDTDPNCFKHVDDDAEKNYGHYLNLLVQWQHLALTWHENWDSDANDSHVWLAAFGDAQEFIFGSGNTEGLTAHLNHIGFDATDEQITMCFAEAESAAPRRWKFKKALNVWALEG